MKNKENCLAYVKPELVAEWHPTKNGSITPYDVAVSSNKKVWWKCREGHEWEAVIAHRTKGVGCAVCSNRRVLPGYNDLATTDPDLAAEWHPCWNLDLKPTNLTRGSGKSVWWKCKEGHAWCATPNKRTSDGTACPYCTNQKVLRGYNDLETRNPRLAQEWHPFKNHGLSPGEIVEGSAKRVWWQCVRGHEWVAAPYNRLKNKNCPICSKQLRTSFPEQALYYYIKMMFSDAENANVDAIDMELDIYIPSRKFAVEYDGVYYHDTEIAKEREMRKNQLCINRGIRLIRVREIGLSAYSDCECILDLDPTNMPAINQAITSVLSLMGVNNCNVDTEKDSPSILATYLTAEHKKSLERINLKLAAEWHPTKNGKLKPEHLAINSGKHVWWTCANGHEWQASLHNRAKGKGCPYCSGRVAITGENDLLTLYPELVEEWSYDKNAPLLPSEVKPGSDVKVWWKCRTCAYEWKSAVANRKQGRGCPKCGEQKKGPKRKTHAQFAQELQTINPLIKLTGEYLVSTQKVECRCLACGHEWAAQPGNLLQGKGCPVCAKNKQKKPK